MDKHIKTKYKTGNFQALAIHKPQLSQQSINDIRHMLAVGVSKKAICTIYGLTYADLKTFK